MSNPPEVLSPAERKVLKARAHRLEPVVLIGDKGLSDALIAEVERALAAHELIKLRAPGLERDEREAALAELCTRCGAQPVQHIGKVLVLYRKAPPEGKSAPASRNIRRARGQAAKPNRPRKPAGVATGSARRESRNASGRPGSAPRPSPRRTSRSARARSAN
ncbi:MAG: YhbY family RNA-binding protein [Betaproteobacteria bacterium]|nr:YhbY family RNA-binding protein [Betaproteobacteria bacterium]